MKKGRKTKAEREAGKDTREQSGREWARVEEQRIPAGHDPANEPENANQSHDAALEIVHLRSNAAIPFPGLCCTCWWCGVTATNTQPTNAPPGYVTATVQRRNETDIAAERALSRPTCPTRPGEPPPPARSSSGNNVSPTLPVVTRLRLLADPRYEPRLSVGVLHRISETTQYMPDGQWQSPDGPFTRHLNTHRIFLR